MGEKRGVDMLKQWHDTNMLEEGGVIYFLKKYESNSYEIRNEISWLTSTMLRYCRSFRVPEVHSSSVEDGWVKMEHIDITSSNSEREITDWLIKSALELHSIVKTEQPRLRIRATADEYSAYTHTRVMEKIKSVENTEFKIEQEMVDWILNKVDKLSSRFFTISHRDLRARHLLFSDDHDRPTLIDWEFSDISDPAQDLAKLIYDAVVDRRLGKNEIMKYVLDAYSQDGKHSPAEIEDRVRVFMPIIPLEHMKSFIARKPTGYEAKLIADLCYIRSLYEEEK